MYINLSVSWSNLSFFFFKNHSFEVLEVLFRAVPIYYSSCGDRKGIFFYMAGSHPYLGKKGLVCLKLVSVSATK